MKKNWVIALLLLMIAQNIFAQWDGNASSVNNPVSNAPLAERTVFSVTDNAGGAILAWLAFDFNTNTEYIYAQRKTATGAVSWSTAANPLEVFSTASGVFPDIGDVVADGNGGAYITWVDYDTDTASNIYLQRISSSGAKLFPLPGIKINPSPIHRYTSPKICVDAAGIIVCWRDALRDGNTLIDTAAQLFCQRYNTAGSPLWAAGGVQVSTVASVKAIAAIVSDGSNGVLTCFTDTRNSGLDINGIFDNVDIYAQRLSSTGARLWGATDALVTNSLFNQFMLEDHEATTAMISDGAGGFILVYNDRSSDNYGAGNLYAQRLSGTGIRLWPTGGVLPGNINSLYKVKVKLESDGTNGMVVTWNENDFQVPAGGIYAQHITSAGTKAWGTAGVIATGSLTPANVNSTMTADGLGNYVIAWANYDNVSGLSTIKGQKINGNGALQWAVGGVNICTNPLSYADEANIVRSTGGAMLVAWVDSRNGSTSRSDIYSAKLEPDGSLTSSTSTNYITIANGNWNSASSWTGNAVPPAGANVIIRHNIIGNVNTSCNSLRVESPGTLTVNTGITVALLQ